MMKLKRNQKGFTLIEVLLIVVILGIIAAIAIPRLMASKQEAQTSSCHSNCANINTALEKYYFDSGTYPADTTAMLAMLAAAGVDPDGAGPMGVTIYMPDGPPSCPTTGSYQLTTSKRAKCTVHGDINGGT